MEKEIREAKVEYVSPDLIKPSPFQPRMEFNLEDIRGSVIKDGISVPLTVRIVDDHYELIDGERRSRVAKQEGIERVPIIIIEADDDKADRLIWSLNTVRKDYIPKEMAYDFLRHKEKGMSIRGIARYRGYNYSTVTAYLNVFKLPDKYQEKVWDRASKVGIGHIREMEPWFTNYDEYSARILAHIEQIITQDLSQRETRELVQSVEKEEKNQRIKVAKESLKSVETPEIKLETAEDYEKAANAFKKEARKRKTPEQLHKEQVERAKTSLSSIKRDDLAKLGIGFKILDEIGEYIEDDSKRASEAIKALKKDMTAKRKTLRRQKEKARLMGEAKKEAKAEMLSDPVSLEIALELAKKEYEKPSMPEENRSAEEIEEFKERSEQFEKEIDDLLADPDVQRRGRKLKNISSLMGIAYTGAFCPFCNVEADEGLFWTCCNTGIKEMLEKAKTDFEKEREKWEQQKKNLGK